MKFKYLNLFFAVIILISNIPLIKGNYEIIKTQGGPMGVGLIVSPFLLFCNLFIITAFLSFLKKYQENKLFFILNLIGIICCGGLAFLLMTTPKMD